MNGYFTSKELLVVNRIPVKIKQFGWGEDRFIDVKGYNDKGLIGFDELGLPTRYAHTPERIWLRWEKSKRIIKKYLCARPFKSMGMLTSNRAGYYSEKEMQDVIDAGFKIYKGIPENYIEVYDEDDKSEEK